VRARRIGGLARGGRLVSELTRAAEEARLDRGLSMRGNQSPGNAIIVL
jgi:hypothetical protein